MKLFNRALTATAIGAMVLSLAGCMQKEGPAEHAGKAVDKAMDQAGQQIEKAGESVQDAAKGDKK
jgi:predicted small lipoprotein YifL